MGALKAVKLAPNAARENMRRLMEQGSLNLRGVAAALRLLAADTDDAEGPILSLIARDVDLEADAMGEAELFLLGPTKDGA